MPATEKKGGRQPAQHDDIDIFSDKKKAEAHAGIFGMKTGNQLALGLGKIKGYPFALGNDTDQKNHESQRLIDNKPAGLPGHRRSPRAEKIGPA